MNDVAGVEDRLTPTVTACPNAASCLGVRWWLHPDTGEPHMVILHDTTDPDGPTHPGDESGGVGRVRGRSQGGQVRSSVIWTDADGTVYDLSKPLADRFGDLWELSTHLGNPRWPMLHLVGSKFHYQIKTVIENHGPLTAAPDEEK